jgi:hypothetical protein
VIIAAGSAMSDYVFDGEDGSWTGYQDWLVCLTAITVVFDGFTREASRVSGSSLTGASNRAGQSR